jgi:nucleotide-binding universal stress UspA family protein
MKKILVATDFSSAAYNAAKYAVEMASAIHADILLFHVYQIPVIYSEVPIAVDQNEMMKNIEKDMVKLKDDLTVLSIDNINIQTEVKMGVFFHELKLTCEQLKPYSVIMGSQGTTAAERLLFGSHTVFAMKHLMWPLITVPTDAKFSGVKKIGLACDFNEVVNTTPVDEIKMLVKDFNAELHILNTGKEEIFNPDIVFESGLLQEMLIGIEPHYHFISNNNIDDGIIDFAEKNNINLLLVLPKRHGIFDRLVHKSHTKQLVLHSPIPVMALHQ